MADRQWFLTKLTGSAMGILLLISMGISAANLHFDLKRDVELNKASIVEHKEGDAEKWVDVWEDVDKHGDEITDIRLSQMQMETQFLEIIRRLDELKGEIERWEPSPRG